MSLKDLRKMTLGILRGMVTGFPTEAIYSYIDALAIDRHNAFKKDDPETVQYCDDLVRVAMEELKSRGVAAEAGVWICESCQAVQTIKVTRCNACGEERESK